MNKARQQLDQKLSLLGRHRAAVLSVAAGVFVLAGAQVLYSCWQMFQGAGTADLVVEMRDRIAQDIGERGDELRSHFLEALTDPRLRADLEAGAYADAAGKLRTNWPALTDSAAYRGTLDDAYAAGIESVGYGELALLSGALVKPEPVLGLTGTGGSLKLAIAAAVRDERRVVAVAYGETELAALVAPLDAFNFKAGLLELRSGTRVVSSLGDAGLHAVALPIPIRGTPLLLAAAAAQSGAGSSVLWLYLATGLLLLLLGGVAFASVRPAHAPPMEGADGQVMTVAAVAATARTPAGSAAVPVISTRAPAAGGAAGGLKVDRSIFRAYDIRGVLGETLDAGVARLIGAAIGSEMRDRGLRDVVVGRDGRLSGPTLMQSLIDGLRNAGCDVIDIGQAATPLVYFGSEKLNAGSCVAVTGSHNPPEYNGFKVVLGGETLHGDAILALYARIADNRLRAEGGGALRSVDVSRDYIERISSDIQLERRMHVVVDSGNGVAGAIAPDVLDAIGCQAEQLHCEVDGNFPNHHPDPSDLENLRDLITSVKRTGAELGIAFDGDGDRLGVVTRQGEVIYADRLLMLFANDVLSRNPGAAVIYDVKCTGHLAGQILRHGGSPIMWKTGHSLIKAKMKETDAELAGEMSGHFFFRERWYGFDDGIYAAARLLEILAADGRPPEEIFDELPKGVSTPELKVKMAEGEHFAFVDRFREKARFEGAKIITIDGVRADWADGWGLVRCSNTTPSLVLRFDADNGDALERIKNVFRSQLLALRSDLDLPF